MEKPVMIYKPSQRLHDQQLRFSIDATTFFHNPNFPQGVLRLGH